MPSVKHNQSKKRKSAIKTSTEQDSSFKDSVVQASNNDNVHQQNSQKAEDSMVRRRPYESDSIKVEIITKSEEIVLENLDTSENATEDNTNNVTEKVTTASAATATTTATQDDNSQSHSQSESETESETVSQAKKKSSLLDQIAQFAELAKYTAKAQLDTLTQNPKLSQVIDVAKQVQDKMPKVPKMPEVPKVEEITAMANLGVHVGSSYVKSKFPKTSEFVEKVATDWVNDGDFKELPLNTPLVQHYVAEGLKQAKSVEKKIEEKLENSGVLTVAKHQLQRAKKVIKK